MDEWMDEGHILFWRKTTITIGNGQVIPTENGYGPCEIKMSRQTCGENVKNPLGICNGRRHTLWCLNNTIHFENLFFPDLYPDIVYWLEEKRSTLLAYSRYVCELPNTSLITVLYVTNYPYGNINQTLGFLPGSLNSLFLSFVQKFKFSRNGYMDDDRSLL